MDETPIGSIKANGVMFRYLEAGEGPLVLCLHGFPDNAYTFCRMMSDLADAGFRVVAPFMRGYAPTEVPSDGRYQSAVLGMDVLALIQALGAERAALVGHDWGAEAALGAAALEPTRVTKLVTLDDCHPGAADTKDFNYLRGVWHSYYFQHPDAEETVSHNDFAFLEDWWRNASPEWDIPPERIESVKETFRAPGVVKAALDYYRHSLNQSLQDPALREAQKRVDTSPISVPTLAMNGTRDRPGRLEAFQATDSFFTGPLEKVVLQGAGHFTHLERPEEVNRRIVKFFKS